VRAPLSRLGGEAALARFPQRTPRIAESDERDESGAQGFHIRLAPVPL
jgi:hypothetical protein